MAGDLELRVENVGGITTGAFKFAPGLNLVQAQNAAGKTSLVRALELTCLEDSDLKGKADYMNLFASGAAAKSLVQLRGPIELERRFRAVNEDLFASGDESLYPLGGGRAVNVCFATPDNTLIQDFLGGRSVRTFIEDLSGSSIYDNAASAIAEIQAGYDGEWMRYREDLVRLEEAEKDVGRLGNRKQDLEGKLESLPHVDYEKILEDEEARNRREELDKKSHVVHEKVLEVQSRLEEKKSDVEVQESRLAQQEKILEGVGKTAKSLNEDIRKVSSGLANAREALVSVQTRLRRINDEIDMVNRNFEKRQRHGIEEQCVACGQPLSAAQLETRRKELEQAQRDIGAQLKSARREVEDLEDEQSELEFALNRLKEAEAEESRIKKSLVNRESEASQLEKQLEKLRGDYDSLRSDIEGILSDVTKETLETFRERQSLADKIDEVNAQIDGKMSSIEQLKGSRRLADAALLNKQAAETLAKHLRVSKVQVLNEVKDRYEGQVNDLLEELRFENFENVRIGDDFRVYVHRSGYLREWPTGALSTSERLTLAVAFLLAAKQAYLPDFPFFVLDELITSYDPSRFESLKEHVAAETDYVILTALSGDEGKLSITHPSVP